MQISGKKYNRISYKNAGDAVFILNKCDTQIITVNELNKVVQHLVDSSKWTE